MELFMRIILGMAICYLTIGLVCFILKKTKNNLLQTISDDYCEFFKSAITVLLIILFLLNCADALLTWYAITYLGAYEANGIMAWLIGQGWFWFFLFKMSMITLVVTELYFLYVKNINIFNPKKTQKKRHLLESTANTCVFVGLYVWVCFHNLSVIFSKL